MVKKKKKEYFYLKKKEYFYLKKKLHPNRRVKSKLKE